MYIYDFQGDLTPCEVDPHVQSFVAGQIRERIAKVGRQFRNRRGTKRPYPLGAIVRIQLPVRTKTAQALPRFSLDTFRVVQIWSNQLPYLYKVADASGQQITQPFYADQLELVALPDDDGSDDNNGKTASFEQSE